jgi:glycosyltransferase involved in cell wall biosynthesis
MRRAHPSLVHFLSLYTPVLPPRPYIITIHDLIHLRYPQYFKTKVGPYYQTVVRFACSRAECVITDDPRTVLDLERFLGVDPARVRVVPLGADDIFFAGIEPYKPARPYVIYAGNHREHKDLPTLFEAWAGLPSDIALDLYVTGVDDFAWAHRRYSRQNGRIIAVGDVAEIVLASYYAGARALVHPALCEGFGLPMLEAMAAGCPVIACEDAVPSVLAEVALTFPARDPVAARTLLERVLRDAGLARNLVIQGQERARQYTWDRCAAQTAQIYREVLKEQTRR